MISVIVATLNRPHRVRELLDSILKNTVLPNEVILVEQGDVEKLTAEIGSVSEFEKLNIKIIHQTIASLSLARQRGVEESAGEILIFLDDDMLVTENFLEVANDFLNKNPNILGLTGSFMKDEPAWTFKKVLGVLFFIYSFRCQNVVLMSGCYDYVRGSNQKTEQIAEWLFGGNMVVRRRVFQEGIGFNTNFLRWSFGEDAMFSYEIHKKYPDSLRYLPNLEVIHNEGKENKMILKEVIKMKIIYRYIFWKKEVTNGCLLYTLAYLWSQLGLVGLDLIQTKSFLVFKTQIKTYFYLFKNRERIINEQIDYNQFIFDRI